MHSLTIENIPRISAIYFALLQSGYDFYTLDRTPDITQALRSFTASDTPHAFFSQVKQASCTAYPYWPRAALLEGASFFLRDDFSGYHAFDQYKYCVESTGNLTANDLSPVLWQWLADFPAVLRTVLQSAPFARYLAWENAWIAQQNALHQQELARIRRCLDLCAAQYNAALPRVRICLCPIKCIHASDYHTAPDQSFICTLGALDCESVLHELLHTVLHPHITSFRQQILQKQRIYPHLDSSYYLNGGAEGQLNAFEEHAVRHLSVAVAQNHAPQSLDEFLQNLLNRS